MKIYKKEGVGLYAFMKYKDINSYSFNDSYIIPYTPTTFPIKPYTFLDKNDFKLYYNFVMEYEGDIIAFDKAKGWVGFGDIFDSNLNTLETYSNIIYNQTIFEQIVKKVFNKTYGS